MMTCDDLLNQWNAILPIKGQSVGRRADSNHPLDFFITYDENACMQLVLVTEYVQALPDSSKQILVRENRRSDGKYAVCFSLVDQQLKEQYVFLCWDILNSTYEIQDKKIGAKEAIKRFSAWQKLFAEMKGKKLSDSEIKGLIGELTVLKEVCLTRYDLWTAITGWVGPIGADRDFEYADSWYESKFVSISTDKVKISSLDQLDTDMTGKLILCRGEKTAATAVGAKSLNQLIEELTDIFAADSNALTVFKNKMAVCGCSSPDERFDQAYTIHHLEKYMVTTSFPSIRRSELPAEITEGEYCLSIPTLQKWKVE